VEFIKLVDRMLLYLVKLQTFAATTLNIDIPQVYAASKKFLSMDKVLPQ
jgi:hypothetical protein